jgi:hypothetical protein
LTYSRPDTTNWALTEGAKNLGSDLVTNGSFTTDTDWTKQAGWTISGGVASASATSGLIYQAASITDGKMYKVTFTVSNYSAGTVTAHIHGSGSSTARSANGTYVEYITASGGGGNIHLGGTSFTGDIDNFIVEEVEQLVVNADFAAGDDGNWTKGTGWSIGSGVASCDGTQTANSDLSQSNTLTIGNTYKVTFTISNYSAGAVRCFAGNGTFRSANGTYTEYLVAAGTGIAIRANSDFVGDIDDVIVIPAIIEQTTTGMDGASDSAVILTDDDTGAQEAVYDDTTVPNDSNVNLFRVFVAKDSDQTRFPRFNLQLRNGTLQQIAVQLNTQTGATSTTASTGTVAADVRDTGAGWWEVLLSVANNGTGNTVARTVIYPAGGVVIGSVNDAATGSITVHSCELHLNTSIGAIRGMPVLPATSGSTVTVNATDYSFDDANHSDTQGGYFAEYQVSEPATGAGVVLSMGTSGSVLPYFVGSVQHRLGDGTNTATLATAMSSFTSTKIASAYGQSSMRLNVANSWSTAASYDGAFGNTLSKLSVGLSEGRFAPAQVMLARNIRRYDLDYVAAQAKIDELMS